ncbi:DsbA family oxidoreductase [Bacillus massiliigorillae]|uniref:DsbA family oxidoreductase n=1 Tax=Bacillus massiliigorillae TaxID=1243664 RepID=UPI0003A09F02|nr:DsbA family oxidoreductase [Bacillus massiliigorillae]
MKVEVWSDFACPFCYIGKRRFEQGLEKFAHKDRVEVIFKSYQLEPHSPKVVDKDIYTVLSEKQGVSYEQAKGFTQQITQQAKELGLEYNFDDMVLTNTFAAHRLSHYAKQQGKMYEMMERILKAYFTDSVNISDYDVLTKLATEVGFDEKEVQAILTEGKYSEDVQNDMKQAVQIGVRGVPFFVFNQKYAVSGAQAGEAFLEVLEKVWEEEQGQQPLQVLNSDNDDTKGANCADGACNI